MSDEGEKVASGTKRPREDSSSDDEDLEDSQGQIYHPPPGYDYKRDKLICDQCGVGFRKHSDLKKHNARHARQYRCVEEGCPRSAIGFATINDLYRHEKSVHGKHVGKSRMYKCFAPGCAKASKLWPRLDNFKQHLIRMHPNENIEGLVKKSEQWHEEEEGDGLDGISIGESQHPDNVLGALQNISRLRSPTRLSGQPRIEVAGRRWDVTPPTTANQGPPQMARQPVLDFRHVNGERRPEAYIQPQPAPNQTPHSQPTPQMPLHPRPGSVSQTPDSKSNPNEPQLEADENKTISRAAEVRELSSEARCGSCHLAGRRCYIDQSNPQHCVSCPTENHCIFRRTVVREGPATHFLWHELVGTGNIPQQPLRQQQPEGPQLMGPRGTPQSAGPQGGGPHTGPQS